MATHRFEIGDGIRLTKIHTDDADELFDLVVRNRDHLRKWMPWADTIQDVSDTLAFVERSVQQDADGQGFQCCIRVGDEGIVGVVGHVRINHADRRTELGYWISEEYQGRGIVTKAVQALIQHAFSELNLNRVELQTGVENRRSRAIAERLGFHLEGTLRESEWVNGRFVSHVVYGLLRSDGPL